MNLIMNNIENKNAVSADALHTHTHTHTHTPVLHLMNY